MSPDELYDHPELLDVLIDGPTRLDFDIKNFSGDINLMALIDGPRAGYVFGDWSGTWPSFGALYVTVPIKDEINLWTANPLTSMPEQTIYHATSACTITSFEGVPAVINFATNGTLAPCTINPYAESMPTQGNSHVFTGCQALVEFLGSTPRVWPEPCPWSDMKPPSAEWHYGGEVPPLSSHKYKFKVLDPTHYYLPPLKHDYTVDMYGEWHKA